MQPQQQQQEEVRQPTVRSACAEAVMTLTQQQLGHRQQQQCRAQYLEQAV
jgi:hypothetical protein